MDMKICLLFENKLPNKLLAKVARTFVYLLNRLPTRSVKDNTSFEGWFGFKPSVLHFKIFGFLCYALIPDIKRNKLEKRAQPSIFVGYNRSKKRYMIFYPFTSKVF